MAFSAWPGDNSSWDDPSAIFNGRRREGTTDIPAMKDFDPWV
jgi:hypothetical protein